MAASHLDPYKSPDHLRQLAKELGDYPWAQTDLSRLPSSDQG